MEVIGTMSGLVLHAQDLLTSYGGLVVEGTSTFNGAAIFGSTVKLNGVTYTFPTSDGSASGKVLKTDSAGQLSWSSDTDTDTNTTYSAGQGLTLGGTVFRLSDSFSGTSLEIIGTASGRVLHAQDLLSVSGSLVIDEAGSVFGAGLSDCDGANNALQWNASTGKFSCATLEGGGGFVDYHVHTAGDTMTGALTIKKTSGTSTGNILIVDTKGLVYDATNKRVGIGSLLN